MAKFCRALGTQRLTGGMGLSQWLPAASLDKATEMGETDQSAIAKAFPSGPCFSLSRCSQLLVDTGICCCLSVGFALFCFNLSTSFMCLN